MRTDKRHRRIEARAHGNGRSATKIVDWSKVRRKSPRRRQNHRGREQSEPSVSLPRRIERNHPISLIQSPTIPNYIATRSLSRLTYQNTWVGLTVVSSVPTHPLGPTGRCRQWLATRSQSLVVLVTVTACDPNSVPTIYAHTKFTPLRYPMTTTTTTTTATTQTPHSTPCPACLPSAALTRQPRPAPPPHPPAPPH